jgi:phosphopantethiene--protein transferase domain
MGPKKGDSMILGIGIDAIEIDRFTDWATLAQESLKKTLTQSEINYCLAIPAKAPERFAARFAAKEAFFKAFCQMSPEHDIPFLTICQNTSAIQAQHGRPELVINWENLLEISKTQDKHQNPEIISHITITHTKNTATVIVILERL